MMTDQPARVSPAEITALLDQMRAITPDTPLAEQIAYFERKADLLARVAGQLGTTEARQVAAEARQQVAALIARHDREEAGR